MLIIPGKIVRGHGVASQTLALQMPFFGKAHPELKACRCATINVSLECQLEVISPSFKIGPLDWSGDGIGELFGFVKIHFEVDESETDAWIYIPYRSPHRSNPYQVEILAPPLVLKETETCRVHLTASKVTA